jgi:hypothetical protein
LTHALVLRRDFQAQVPAEGWTKQLSRVQTVALAPSTTAARKFPGALETLAFPAAAFQNNRFTLQRAGSIGCRRDAHGGAVGQFVSAAGAAAITTSAPMALRFRGTPAGRRSRWRHGSGVLQQGGVLNELPRQACQSLAWIGKLAAAGWRFGSNSHSYSPGPAVQFNWGLCCVLRPDCPWGESLQAEHAA